ncbi:MAG: iron-containing alcohol dehydrogenase [Cetobacterium sp.]|uniref:iron-containing alcohol dehydrogenase n=1 Tax=Cetobacterium sp. TaxID=2071632 RepID=UPI003EE468EA
MLAVRKIYWPALNIVGPGALSEGIQEIAKMNLGKALIVTDKGIIEAQIIDDVTKKLTENNLEFAIFSEVSPNPTVKNVNEGLELLKKENCDYIISLGGGSPQDAAKAIGILATNGGDIRDYNGVSLSKNKSLPIIAINTTSGTASEVTINYVITDEEKKVKMVIVDSNSLATISINDPELMLKKPKQLTAATGMDALTHAIEAYTTLGAYRLSDILTLESIKIIGESLENAVENGEDLEARSKMAWGSFIAGLAFSNCGLGIVHSMAHQLGSEYNLPHGVANAILLPEVVEYNLSSNYKKFKEIAEALGENVKLLSDEEGAKKAVEAIRKLSNKIDIPKLKDTKFNLEDIQKLSNQAFNDICTGGNPKQVTVEAIENIYLKAYKN